MHSNLFFLKKSGNEKNTVNRIGAKIKRPTPGANSIPNDEVRMYEIGLEIRNPDSSVNRGGGQVAEAPVTVSILSSGWIYLKVPPNLSKSLNTK